MEILIEFYELVKSNNYEVTEEISDHLFAAVANLIIQLGAAPKESVATIVNDELKRLGR